MPGAIDVSEMRAHLGSRVKGQNALLDDLCRFLAERMTQPRGRRPLASLCFIGDHSTVKTVLAEAIAEYVYGDPKSCIRFDSIEFTSDESKFRLIGSPRGYVGAERGGVLTRPLLKNPKRLIMFEELERVGAAVGTLLIEILKQGRLRESTGGIADFSEAIVILNSFGNARGYQEIADEEEYVHTAKRLWACDRDGLENPFRGEILLSVDKVCVFRQLTDRTVLEIALQKATDLAAEYGVELAWLDPAILLEAATSVQFGIRSIERELCNLLGDELIAAKEAGWQRVRLELNDGRPAARPDPIAS
jgi:ATP-dependent Clp protease ATP-binding subunit ClpC